MILAIGSSYNSSYQSTRAYQICQRILIIKFEEKLGEKLFCRCHNSFLINLDYVEGLHNDFVVMRDKKEVLIPVSKYKKEQLLKMLANYVSMYSS